MISRCQDSSVYPAVRYGRENLAPRAAAQVFEQQNHLVFPVGRSGAALRAVSRVFEGADAFGQLRAAALRGHAGFQNAGAEKIGNVLQFVRRHPPKKPLGMAAPALTYVCAKSTYQGSFHGAIPVRTET